MSKHFTCPCCGAVEMMSDSWHVSTSFHMEDICLACFDWYVDFLRVPCE